MSIPVKLVDCKTVELQVAWIEHALRAGRTPSDSGLWLAGVDRPERVIARLRRAGVPITTTTKRVTDAADEVHNDLAWCLTVDLKTSTISAGRRAKE